MVSLLIVPILGNKGGLCYNLGAMAETVATNKKAFRDFILSDKWECGIALKGAEVKSVRAGEVNFKDAFARVEKGEVFLYSLHIAPYTLAGIDAPEPDRRRKLLMHKKELLKMADKAAQQNLALVPTKMYFNSRGLVKIEIALGRGKKMFDKRDTVKKPVIKRSLDRVMKNRNK